MFKLLSKLSILLSFIQLCVSMNSFLYFNKSEFVQRVSNGRAAKLGDVPYQVAFKALYSRIRNLYVTFCGGVIIGPAKLISAAHCFEEKNSYCRKFWSKSTEVSDRVLRRVVAVAGNLQNIVAYSYRDSLQSGQWRSVYNIIYPTNYRFPIHDISIITLNHPFTFNQYVSSIPIASQFIDYRGKCLVSGYGRITETISSEKLLLADLEIISARLCSALHNRNMQHFVCTSDLISDVKKAVPLPVIVSKRKLFMPDKDMTVVSNHTTAVILPPLAVLNFATCTQKLNLKMLTKNRCSQFC
ncbi:prostasin isoform X2 [Bombyx mori]|uniref:prostasin isoform X2 n=1 Tax=Bombyx mori TaxID=7091 RepID=UPI002ED2CED3